MSVINLCNFTLLITFIIIVWFLYIQFKEESFSENINANPKMGNKTIRGSSIYFSKNPQINKGFLSNEKF